MLEAIEETMSVVLTTFSSVQIPITFFAIIALKYIWNLVNVLQFVVFTHYWNVNLPPNVEVVITKLKYVALGEFIPYDWLFSKVESFLAVPSTN